MFDYSQKLKYSVLLEHYSGLLNSASKDIAALFFDCDLSLSEIADQHGITRQGVYDSVVKTARLLDGYEEKLKLNQKYQKITEKVKSIAEISGDETINRLLDGITEILGG